MSPSVRPPDTPSPPARSTGPDLTFYLRLTGVFALVLLTGVLAGILIERNLRGLAGGGESSFSDLDAVVDILDDSYYYRPTSDTAREGFEKDLEQNAISGMLGGLDGYTAYLAPPDAERATNQLEGRAVGIGAEFMQHEDQAMIVRVFPDTPAADAGLQAGDVVVRIDGQPANAADWNDFVSRIQGQVGTTVRLGIQRPGNASQFDLEMTRREYVVPSVDASMVPGTDVGWVQIHIFGSNTASELDAALVALAQQGAQSVILDLRGNGGGWVTAAQEVIGRFVDPSRGPALYEDATPGPGGEQSLPIEASGERWYDVPLVVLTDGNTASAAEIVAGALQAYDRAPLVGEKTFGKGSVQRVYTFRDGASLRVTFAEWLTPNKARIQDHGIAPDVAVAASEQPAAGQDPVLDRAVQIAQADLATPASAATPAA